MAYSYPRAALTKHHKLGGLEQQRLILSQLWGLEVESQGVGWVGSFFLTLYFKKDFIFK